jgi:hypothetical protein
VIFYFTFLQKNNPTSIIVGAVNYKTGTFTTVLASHYYNKMTEKINNINVLKNTIHFGLDHLEIYGTCKMDDLFEKLDFDNSNY